MLDAVWAALREINRDRFTPFALQRRETMSFISRSPLLVVTLVAAILPGSTAGAESEKRILNVFLFAGQSNMAGADSVVAEPPGFQATEADRETLFTAHALRDGDAGSGDVSWSDVRGHRHSPNGPLVQGPEVGFARGLYDAGWRDVAIIKVYANFSRDVPTWPWAQGGSLFNAWTRFVDARLAELTAQGHQVRVRGFVWHQGIDDAIHGTLASQYERNLSDLISVLRTRYGDVQAPFILARSVDSPIARNITGRDDHSPMSVVRRAQVKVGEHVSHAAWINVDDLPNVNSHHFSAASQLIIGKRFGEAFLKLSKESDAASD